MCCAWAGVAAALPQDLAVSVGQIQAALERGDRPGAEAALEAALRVHPEDPALNNLAGVIAAQNGNWQAAEMHFRTAIRLAPRAVPPYENLGRSVPGTRPSGSGGAAEGTRGLPRAACGGSLQR